MSRKASVIIGWMVIAVSILCFIGLVPGWNVQGSGRGGSSSGESSPFHTTEVGSGRQTIETYWSISWPAAAMCGIIICCGVMLVRRKRASIS